MKLLLIEDDPRIIEFLARGLSAEGYEVEVATDGMDGFEKAGSQPWDLIVLDLMLPKMDGRKICQALRKMQNNTPIMMLTALETTEDIVRGLRMGADDYMTKPFSFDELVARLEVMQNRTPAHATEKNAPLVAGEITFDRDALVVTRGDEVIELTSLEYALLEFLMVQAGNVVSRVGILQNVWGTHEDPLTNVVDVYIRRLRVKLDGDAADSCISTVRGRGYRFNT